MRGRLAAAVEAATAAGDQGDLMTRRDEFTNHAQSWRRAAVGARAALVVTLGPRPAGRPTRARRRGRRWVRRAPGEATLVGWLRESASDDPRFAFVALDGDRVVGHVMATWGDLDGAPALGLGPLSVEPSRQGQGIGSRLMGATLGAARHAGASVIVLLGGRAITRVSVSCRLRISASARTRHGASSSRRVLSRTAGGATVTLKARHTPDRAASSPTLSRSRAWGGGRRTPSWRLSGANEGGRPMRRPASRVRERREAPEARQRVASATLRQGQVSSSLTVLNRTSTPSLTSVPAAGVCEQTFQCLSSSWGRLVPSASSECET